MSELHYFNGVKTEKGITARYRKLAKEYHPDNATNDTDRANFNEVMKDINREHQEVLVLLKYKAFDSVPLSSKQENGVPPVLNEIKKNVKSVLTLTPDQKDYVVNQGRQTLNYIYDSIIGNIINNRK